MYSQYVEVTTPAGETFYECIRQGALQQTLSDGHNIFCLRDHDWNNVLGRSRTNLTLTDREDGLHFELTPNSSSLGRDMLEDVSSQLVKGYSIGFHTVSDQWEQRGSDWYRTITELVLNEVTLTSLPVYSTTTAQVGSPPAATQEEDRETVKELERQLDDIAVRIALLQGDEALSH